MAKTTAKSMHPAGLALLAWVCPGAAHYRLGKLFRAGLFFVAVAALFWLGIYLKAYITFPNTPDETFALFKFLGAAASGFHFVLALVFGAGLGDLVPYKEALTNEIGNTCLYTAGILNVLTVIDALDIRAGRKK
jgi:hypothetical protein